MIINSKLDSLDEYIKDPELLVVIGLAFMNEVFIKYLYPDREPLDVYFKWFAQKKNLIERYLGRETATLLEYFIKNFDKGSPLRITHGLEESKVHRILFKCYNFLMLLGCKRFLSPLTSIFFNDRFSLHENIDEIFNSNFIIGNYPGYRIREAKHKLIEFALIKGTKTYRCSDTCDYIYFIENCGQAMATGKCPVDGAAIGGGEHKLIVRAGHVELTDDQAKAHLQACIVKYENQEPPGYHIYKHVNANEDKYLSSLKPVTFSLINAMIRTNLLMLISLELKSSSKIGNLLKFTEEFTQADLGAIKADSYVGFLNQSIENNLEKVERIITSLGCTDTPVWLYNSIGLIQDLIQKNIYDSRSKANIKRFELEFEKNIIDPDINNLSGLVLNYRNSLIKRKDISPANLLAETEIDEENYQSIKLFRIKSVPVEQNIIDIFENTISEEKRESDYFLVKIFFKTKEKIKQLMSLYPIIKFTNYLMEEYSHNISRMEAINIPIHKIFSPEKPEVKKMFKEFLEAWNNFKSDELQYDCHVLGKLAIDEDSPLKTFLIDNKELGGGMYMAAAIITLSDLHNNILGDILRQMSFINEDGQSLLDNNKYPPQSINEENILKYSILDSQLNQYYINNAGYGKGTDIAYEFDKLQDAILKDFYNKRLIDSTKINFIQYQFELLVSTGNDSNAIIDIRKSIKQLEMQAKDLKKLESSIEQLKEENLLKSNEILKGIYTSLNYLLYYLKNSRESPKLLLSDYCAKLNEGSKKISKYLVDQGSAFSRIELGNILELFFLIEIHYFKYFCKDILKDEYKKEGEKDTIKRLINEIANNKENRYPTLEQMKHAVLRFIIRCSVAELDVEQPISYYIEREDFWNENFDDEMRFNFKTQLEKKEIKISSSLCLFREIEDFINKPKEEIKPKAKTPVAKARAEGEEAKEKVKAKVQNSNKNLAAKYRLNL